MERKINIVQEPSCGDLWCISVNGWYLKRSDGSNMVFLNKKDAEKFAENTETCNNCSNVVKKGWRND